jgi:two-component system, sensor histidine kinase and response regulator
MFRHPLLQRQLRQHLGDTEPAGPLAGLLRAVEATYERFDTETRSKDLLDSNARLLAENERTTAVLESLRAAMRGLDITVAPPSGDGWDDMLSLCNLIQEQVRLRNRAEARLRSNEHELALIVETARDYAIVAYNADGRVVRWNVGAVRLLGHSEGEARNLAFDLTFNAPDQKDGIPGRLLERAREEGDCSFQGMRAHRSGSEFWADSTLSFIPEGPNGPQFVEITRDITFHKRAEDTLRLAKESAEEAGRAKGDFLATMSHEIRTPMNGVVGFAHLLLETPLDNRQRQYAEIINRSGQSLLTIIDDILDFSKIEAGKLEIEGIPYDIATVVEDTVELLAHKAHEKKIELALSCDPSLPAEFVGDPGRVRQILVNLVGNAIKFTQNGHVIVDVGRPETLRERHPSLPAQAFAEAHVLFCVEDTGVGIPADVQPQLFNKFTQADSSTTRKFGGTGLGLAIARRLAGLMDGEMGCTSLQGIGSTFWFTLPLPATTQIVKPLPPDLGLGRVLVVDDNPTVLRLLCSRLDAWKIPHAGAASAGAAKELAVKAIEKGSPFDLVIVDELDGNDSAARLTANLRSLPAGERVRFVLMTATGAEIAPDTLAALGFAAQLPKPVVRRSLLRSTLESVLLRPPVAATPERLNAPPAAARPKTSAGTRVLVAEDSPTNQMLAVRILEELGCTVDLADNGHEAVSKATSRRYDLILMDCQMPDMDGFEAAAAIRRRESGSSRVPIVALTANALQGDRERCLAAGMDDHLTKPLQPDALRSLVSRQATPL